MTKSLRESPSLSSLKYEAKQLLKAHNAGDESACEILRLHSKLADKSNEQILAAKVTLQEVQHALAQEYGFENWAALAEAVEQKKTDRTPSVADVRVNLLDGSRELDATSAEPALGIDIGSSCIKLLELGQEGSKLVVERFGTELVPPGAVVEGNVMDVGAVGDALARLVQRCNPTTDDAVVGITGSAVITKTIEMPAGLSDDEIENEFRQMADQYIPVPLDQVTISFEIKGPSPRDDEKIEVLLAACKRETIAPKCEALERAGIHTRVVDIEAHAIDRAYSRIREHLGIDEEAVVAGLELGSTMSRFFAMVKPGRPPYTREQLFGGCQLTDEIQRRYSVPAFQAEVAVRNPGEGLPDDYAEEVFKPWLEAIVMQTQRSLQFFYSSTAYDSVDHILLCGGVGATKGLAEFIAANLEKKVPVTAVDPLWDMTFSSSADANQMQADAPAFMLACGLALRGVTKHRTSDSA